MNHFFHAGDVDGVSSNKPIAYRRVSLGNDIGPIVFPVLPKTDFDDLPVRRLAIGDCQNSVVQETQAEAVVDVAENRVWWSLPFEWLQVDVCESLFEEPVDEEGEALVVRSKA